MNRRATLMLVVGGVAGIAAPSAGAGAAGLRKREGGRGTSPAAADQAPGPKGMKIGLAPQFQNLKEAGPERQVVAIQYHQDTYRVITADGRSTDFWEANLRFKIDSSHTGPLSEKPVILPTGMMGDRASVFFASPAEISILIKHQG
jgi:cytochrome c